MSEYTEQAEKFMTEHNLEFRVVHIGSDCPTFCEDAQAGRAMDEINKFPRRTHIHGHHYHVTISGKDRGHFTIDFWNSYADEEHNAKKARKFDNPGHYDWQLVSKLRKQPRRVPQPYDVLACIQKYDPGSFDEFCSGYGYDADSRKAEGIYFAVQKEWSKVRRFFTPEEIEQLQEIS